MQNNKIQKIQTNKQTIININNNNNNKPIYIFKYPFRFVKPYQHIFQTYAKKRWLGKNIISILTTQFSAYSQSYFIQAINRGNIKINHKPISINYIIANSDFLQHETIRQQPPILDLPITIIHEDDQLLVVNKPPSITIHTGGGYHYNTLLAILQYEMGYQNLFVLHRLDRLTSGLVIFAKCRDKTTKFHEQSMVQTMKKCYYARVQGNPQFQSKVVNAPLICRSFKQGVWAVYNPQTMKELLKTQQPKESQTKFTKIWYDKQTDSSLLQCFPTTGRTHQIRVHLQYIGYPILNDVVYGGRFIGNNILTKIKQIKDEQQIIDKVQKKIKGLNENLKEDNPIGNYLNQQIQQYKDWYNKWEYKTRPLQIMLHSYRYKFQGKEYISGKPYWTETNAIASLGTLEKLQYKQQQKGSVYQKLLLKKEENKVKEVEQQRDDEKQRDE